VEQSVEACCSVVQSSHEKKPIHIKRDTSIWEESCVLVWRVLQCVAVCCSVLQCVAVCCSVLQCVAVCFSLLQCVWRGLSSQLSFHMDVSLLM